MRHGRPRSTVLWGSAATVSRTSRLVFTALAVALVLVAPAATAPVAPALTSPDDDATRSALPAFKWDAVADAANYQFELAADPAFNSPILNLTTRNTRASGEGPRRQRDLLLAGARRDERRRAGSLVGGAVIRPRVDGTANTARSDERGDDHLSERGARAQLERRPRSGEVSRQGRHRPRAGLAGLGRAVRDGRDLFHAQRPARARNVLLEHHPARRGGSSGWRIDGRILHLVLALRDHART